MRLPWPHSLLWRSFLLIVLLLGASFVMWFQIYREYAQEPRTRQIAQLVVSVINLSRSALLAADSNQRLELLHELEAREGMVILPAETDDPLLPFTHGQQMAIVQEQVRQRLGEHTRFTGNLHGESGFFVSFRLDDRVPDDEYWLRLPAERVERLLPTHWLAWSAIAVIGSLLGAWLLVVGINRPLRALQEAAQILGRGEHPPPLDTRGPLELATLATTFNQMSQDLQRIESDRALILAGVSHDLRTPLARLRLGLELSGAQAEDLAAMSCDIEEMDRIINQFLDFARDQQAESPLSQDLSSLLAELLQACRLRGVKIQADIQPEIVLPLRPQSIRRATSNLIDNATRYAGNESPLDISLRREGREVVLEVADRGPGIPPAEVERLKRPFTRLEAARSNAGGSGLGLAIVERVARLHGGHLALLPRPGGGLRASLHLPAD